ncbi:MAG: hypothetical protein ACE14W_12570 [Candidatus Velamenicoccus archaeovorus]
MLRVTDAAVAVLKRDVLEASQAPQDEPATAVRLRLVATDDGRQGITLQPVAGPQPGDAPAQADELDVFVAPELAGPLDTGILDVQTSAEGPELVLRDRTTAEG